MIPQDKKVERMLEIARMYYEQGKTQSEISKALGMSRPLVSQLLSDARKCGIVTINVNDIRVTSEALADQLKRSFGLGSVTVIREEDLAETTNEATARRAYIDTFGPKQLSKNTGIGWGSMLGFMLNYAEQLPDAKKGEGSIFPLIGGVNSVIKCYHPNEIVRIIALKSGKIPTFLYVPALLETEEELEATRRSESYCAIRGAWDTMEQAVVSISNYPTYPDTGVKTIYGDKLMQQHAVGRVLAYYYDINGSIIKANEDIVTQASMQHLKNTELIAMCSRQLRPEAIIGALRLGIINSLYIPFSLAERVVSMINSETTNTI